MLPFQAQSLSAKKHELQARTVALADRKAKLATATAAAAAKDEEPLSRGVFGIMGFAIATVVVVVVVVVVESVVVTVVE